MPTPSCYGDEEEVILEACSKVEKVNMPALDEFPFPYFYMHLLIIHHLGVIIPFTPFEAEVLVAVNVSPIPYFT